MLRVTLAVVHLLALAIGFRAIVDRASAARSLGRTSDAITRVFRADTWWGISAMLFIGTGLWRAFAGTEKSPGYYWGSAVFATKMALLGVILLLELWPMMTLVRWRIAARRNALLPVELRASTGSRIAMISGIQALLLTAMIVAAVLLARGYGAQ